MANATPAYQLLKRAASILPVSGEDLIYKGVVAGVSERLFTLKRRRSQLERKHGSINDLETRLKIEGATPDQQKLLIRADRLRSSLPRRQTSFRLGRLSSRNRA